MVDAKSFNNIPVLLRALPEIFDLATETAGAYYAGKVVERIVEQDPSWEPKSPATLKAEGPGKTKLWVNTGDLRTEIHAKKPDNESKAGEYVMQVGVFSESRVIAAACLEYGSDTRDPPVPARPLFGPVFDREVDKIASMQKKVIDQQIRKYVFR